MAQLPTPEAVPKRTQSEAFADGGNTNGNNDASRKAVKTSSNRVLPLNPNADPLPECKTYGPEYKILVNCIESITGLLLAPLQNNPYRNEVLDGLSEEIERRTKGSAPEEVRVATVGEMKTGKSMVLNSTMSLGQLARSVRLL